jgi:hypothetical protein
MAGQCAQRHVALLGRKYHLLDVGHLGGRDGTALIRWHYRKAGCIEVAHDVVKNALGAGVLPCAAFGANVAWFRLSLLTYNLLSAMKVLALPPPFEDARPKRLRFAVFNLPARLVSPARKLLAYGHDHPSPPCQARDSALEWGLQPGARDVATLVAGLRTQRGCGQRGRARVIVGC